MGKQKAEQWSLTPLEKPSFVVSGQQQLAEPAPGDVRYNSQHVFFALVTILTHDALGTPFLELLFPQDYCYCRVVWYSETCLCHRDSKYFFLRDLGQDWFLGLAERLGHLTHPPKYQLLTS